MKENKCQDEGMREGLISLRRGAGGSNNESERRGDVDKEGSKSSLMSKNSKEI